MEHEPGAPDGAASANANAQAYVNSLAAAFNASSLGPRSLGPAAAAAALLSVSAPLAAPSLALPTAALAPLSGDADQPPTPSAATAAAQQQQQTAAAVTAALQQQAAAAVSIQQQQQQHQQQQQQWTSSLAALQAQPAAQLLAAAGLQAATALMPTGATAAQLASGMPALQQVPVIIASQGMPPSPPTSSAMSASPMASAASNLVSGAAGAVGGVSAGAGAAPQSPSTLLAASHAAAAAAAATAPAAAAPPGLSPFFAAATPAVCGAPISVPLSLLPGAGIGAGAGAGAAAGGSLTMSPSAATSIYSQISGVSLVSPSSITGSSGGGLHTLSCSSTVSGFDTPHASATQPKPPAATTPAAAQAAAAAALGLPLLPPQGAAGRPALGMPPPAAGTPAAAAAAALAGQQAAAQQAQAQAQAAAAAAAAAASTAGGTLPYVPIAMSALQAANQAPATKVKILLSSGGTYEHATAGGGALGGGGGAWRYTGGETRLVAMTKTTSFSQFLQQLAKATQDVWDESCRLMYELPGSGGADSAGAGGGSPPMLVDLVDDDDLANMWEEVESATSQRPTFKVRVYAQLGGKNRSSGGGTGCVGSGSGGSYTCNSADSNVVARTPQQGREAATPSKEDRSGRGSGGAPESSDAVDASLALARRAAAHQARHELRHELRHGGVFECGECGNMSGSFAIGSGSYAISSGSFAVGRHGGAMGNFACLQEQHFEGFDEDEEEAAPQITRSGLMMRDLEARLEIIRPEDLRVVKLLGTGGFGEVYLARWHSTEVAVKCLNPLLLTPDGDMGSVSRETVGELLKEANTLANLRHPNIVWVFGLVLPDVTDAESFAAGGSGAPGTAGRGAADAVNLATLVANRFEARPGAVRPPALVTEYLGAGSLRAAISRRAEFLKSDSVRIKIALDTARGMDYLHGKRIVHFDLKTANLLVGFRERSPCCKVADFGLSKQKQATYVSGVTSLRGTLPWIAPEIIKTPKEVDEKVDVYSFGVVLWELWTLKEPFEGINYHALLHMMSVAKEPVRPPLPGAPDWEGEHPAQPAAGWSELLQDCWSESPLARPSFSAIVARLEEMARSIKIAKRRTAGA